MRKRSPIKLFDSQSLHAAGVLKAQVEWDQERKQRAQVELQRYLAREPFDYEPHNYEWCAKFTPVDQIKTVQADDRDALEKLMSTGGATLNPVTGQITALYILCGWKNEDGRCSAHEPK